MSLISGAIEHVKFRTDLVAAFDFSQLDGTLTATSLYGSGGQTITFSGVQQTSSDGVLLDGTQTATLNEEVPRTTLHLLYFLKPSVPDFELMDKTAGWDFKLYAVGGVPTMTYQSSYNGSTYNVAHPNALEPDKLTLLSFMNAYSGSKQIVGIGDMGGLTISNETQTNRYYGQTLEAGTPLFENFAGSCAGLMIFNAEVSDADIIEIMAEVGIYGNISLPTNLNQARNLSGTVLTAARAVDGNFTVAADSQTLEGYSESKIGELLEFVAFDTDEAGSIYKTVPVDPSLATELDFQAILGGTSGGDTGQSSKVSGVVQIDGTPAQRTVRAFSYDPTPHDIDGANVDLSKSLGHAVSDPETGDYTIDLLAGYDKRIFVVAFDDYGDDFTPDKALSVGDRVHPTTPNGHVWECTGAGTLPSEEPTWIVDTETAQLYGTASMIAKPFYRPMVHGPVTPEVFTVEEPDPGPPQPLYLVGAGFDHSAVLKPDGTVAVWGGDYHGQVSEYPAGLSNVVAIACGGYFTAALKGDGSIVVWGGTSSAEASPPTDGPYVQVAGNAYNGAALKDDGTLHLWGKDGLSVPSSVNTVGCKFVEGWGDFFLAVLNDGSLVRIGPGPTVPADLPPVAFSGAGRNHGYAIFEDGTVQGFGDSGSGQINTPAGFGDCRQIDGGRYHTIALTQGGVIEHWGATSGGVGEVPTGSDFIAISSGKDHCLAVRQDGTVETWGTGDPVPAGVTAKVN